MATRRPLARNNHLEEAMALLIGNQAAFVEQIARNDQERLAFIARNDQERLAFIARNDQERLALKEWQQKTEARLEKIEVRLIELSTVIEHLPKIIVRDVLDKLPKAVKKEIGFKSPAR